MEPQIIISKSEYDELIEIKKNFENGFKDHIVIRGYESHGPFSMYPTKGYIIATRDEIIKSLTEELQETIKTEYARREARVREAHEEYKRIFGKLFWKALD